MTYTPRIELELDRLKTDYGLEPWQFANVFLAFLDALRELRHHEEFIAAADLLKGIEDNNITAAVVAAAVRKRWAVEWFGVGGQRRPPIPDDRYWERLTPRTLRAQQQSPAKLGRSAGVTKTILAVYDLISPKVRSAHTVNAFKSELGPAEPRESITKRRASELTVDLVNASLGSYLHRQITFQDVEKRLHDRAKRRTTHASRKRHQK